MKTKFENEIFAMLNNGINTVEVDHLDEQTIISVKHNNSEAYVTVDTGLIGIYYTPDSIQDFEEVLTVKLELADPSVICTKIENLVN